MKYVTRQGKIIEKESKRTDFWEKAYSNPIGRAIIKPFTSLGFSRFVGAVLDSRLSVIVALPYVKLFHIDLDEYKPKFYSSYNEFFSREIKEEKRPIDAEVDSFISPCDGKLSLYPIDERAKFKIKHSVYSVDSLLKNKELAKEYMGGMAMVIRLTGEDYHHYCYVAEGLKGRNHYVDGKLHIHTPIAQEYFPVYKENAREYCRIRTKKFGEIIQMEVGAMMIGRICNQKEGVCEVAKGQEKGRFEFGGSTVVVFVKPEQVDFDEDLMQNSAQGIETQVYMGERVGHRFQKDKSLRFFTV